MSTDDGPRRDHDTGHRQLREQLGAYVLGALDHDERLAVEQHLDACASCRDDVARLSSLPPLLDRLSVDEVTAGPLTPPTGLRDAVPRRIVQERGRTRRTLRVWQAAAATLAVTVALVAWAPWQVEPELDAVVATAQPVTAPVAGQAELLAWEWGTTVRLEVVGLPERDTYVLWAVDDDGRRQQAGTWGRTSDNNARVVGASAILRDALARVEITDPEGELLAVFEPDVG
jgi:anti-sigma factor RsiW